MTLTTTDRARLLSQWIRPSSADEQTQQDRAKRMVTDAVKAHAPLSGANLYVYAKGSYANNTNVRRDSDVDIVVECQDCAYYDFLPGVRAATPTLTPYEGDWTPSKFRAEVTAAINNAFGRSNVTSGTVALAISAVPGSRPSIDVVPSFDYFRYDDPYRTVSHRGSCVFPTSGAKIVNWPDQQLTNGRAKNQRTGSRYKNYVRALKNAENLLAIAGTISAKPSYLMECLVWNVSDWTLKSGTLDNGFRATLVELWQGLKDDGGWENWTEPNQLKYVLRGGQKWSRADAKEVVLETWRYLDY
ncbi:nucleotidyltransferase domain-containing protein [Jatrophihabitans fulvus]